MEVQVLAKKENPLLKRTEITFKAIHKSEGTPSRDALRSELAKQLKASKEHVIVDHAASAFGRYETLGYAKVYRSKEEALAVERSHILVRNKLKEPEVKEAKEGAKAEKPARAEKPAAKAEAKPEAKPEHKPEAKAEHKAEKAPAKEEKKPAEKHEEKKAEKKEEKTEAKKAEPKKKEGK
jgi:small subunit ribosomal protein S24e